jgi:RNA polymerase sigma-70 factor (ECF subfamily)
LRILADEDQASDVAQEVFVKLLTKGGNFRREAEWMTWLYRVATNLCLNRIRNTGRRGTAWLKEVRRTFGQNDPGPEKPLLQRELIIALLNEFDKKTQQIVVYYYLDEIHQEEIGRLMGISRVSVNKRLQNFREKVQKLMIESKGDS